MGRSSRGSYAWLMLWVFGIGCCLFLLIASAAFHVATQPALAIGPLVTTGVTWVAVRQNK